jgi:hypothetical protein
VRVVLVEQVAIMESTVAIQSLVLSHQQVVAAVVFTTTTEPLAVQVAVAVFLILVVLELQIKVMLAVVV